MAEFKAAEEAADLQLALTDSQKCRVRLANELKAAIQEQRAFEGQLKEATDKYSQLEVTAKEQVDKLQQQHSETLREQTAAQSNLSLKIQDLEVHLLIDCSERKKKGILSPLCSFVSVSLRNDSKQRLRKKSQWQQQRKPLRSMPELYPASSRRTQGSARRKELKFTFPVDERFVRQSLQLLARQVRHVGAKRQQNASRVC